MTASSPSASSVRQLELTINALARSMRKALRVAEREAPLAEPATSAAWQQVHQRQELLMQLMAAATAYLQAFTPAAQPQPAAEPAPEVPATLPAPAERAQAPEPAPIAPPTATLLEDPLVTAINNLPPHIERPGEIADMLGRITSLARVRPSSSGILATRNKMHAQHLKDLYRQAHDWSRSCPHLGLAAKLGLDA